MKIYLLLLLLLLPLLTAAQKAVRGEILIKAEEHLSILALKEKGIAEAKYVALAKAFGTLLQSNTHLSLKEQALVEQHSVAAVKGVWLETSAMQQQWQIDEEGELWLLTSIKGKAKESTYAQQELNVQLANCPFPQQCGAGQFNSGDDFFVRFVPPQTGFLQVWLEEKGVVYQLYPYQQQAKPQALEAGQLYELFNAAAAVLPKGVQPYQVDEYHLLSKHPKLQKIRVVYSAQALTVPKVSSESGMLSSSLSNWQAWFGQVQSQQEVSYFEQAYWLQPATQ